MAAIVVTKDFELGAFRRHLVERLPDYARPLFLRICRAIETTGTLRPIKQGLFGQGYDPAGTIDPIYFNDRIRAAFIPLDETLYRRLQSGVARL
jgi:fatty-acyl-CoA synthase